MLDKLKVNKAMVIVVLIKYDAADMKKIQEIMQQLQISEHVMIPSRTGYGIYRLKNLIVNASPKMAGDNNGT